MDDSQSKSLEKRQEELEELALSKGAERFIRGLYGELDEESREAGITSRSRQDVSRTQPGKRLIIDYVDRVTEGLKGHIHREKGKEMGRKAPNINPFLFAESLEGVAFLAIKSIIDFYYRSITRDEASEVARAEIVNTLGNEILLELYAQKVRTEPSGEFIAMEEAIANKNVDQSKQKEYLRRRVRLLAKRMEKVDFTNDPTLPFRVGMVIYHILRTEKIIEIKTISDPKDRSRNAVMCKLAPSIAEELHARLDRWVDDHPVWGPMVLPPRPWQQRDEGGYHFKLKNALSLLKNGDKGLTKDECPEVFSAVNHLQSTSYCINHKVLETAQTVFANKNQDEYKLLFKIPINNDSSDFTRKKPSLTPSSLRRMWLIVGVHKILTEAKRLSDYQEIYFVHTMDFRGRIYSKSTYLNPQGPDLCRGLILFGNAKPIENESAVAWLANHGANSFGGALSRESYGNRRKWVDKNEKAIRAVAKAPLDNLGFIGKASASSRWVFIAWCQEWSAFLDNGIGYKSRLPIAVDGTCNGFQHFAALTKSSVLARNVNLIPSDKPSDIYSFVADSAQSEVDDLPKSEHCSRQSVKEILERYYKFLYRGRYIAKHGCEPNEEEYGEAVNNGYLVKSFRSASQEPGDEDVSIVLEDENTQEPDDTAIDLKDEHDDDPEKELAKLGTNEPGESIDEKKKKKLLKSLQECRSYLADMMLCNLVCRPEPIIKFDRDLFKPIVMTFPYSATHSGNTDAIYNTLIENCLFDNYESFYPECVKTTARNLKLEYILAHAISRFARKAINSRMPQAKEVMDYLRKLLPKDESQVSIRWHTPCDLTVRQRYPKISVARRKKMESSGEVFYLRMLDEATVADTRKHKQGISPNFVHSCDAAHLMKTVNASFENGITHFFAVHDSYSTHASDMSKVNQILREEFVKMYEGENRLERLRIDLGASKEKPFPISSQDAFDIRKVLESDYFFS